MMSFIPVAENVEEANKAQEKDGRDNWINDRANLCAFLLSHFSKRLFGYEFLRLSSRGVDGLGGCDGHTSLLFLDVKTSLAAEDFDGGACVAIRKSVRAVEAHLLVSI